MVAALTFATSVITLAGGLEPAYEVAGDSIDDAVDDRVAAYRNAPPRRWPAVAWQPGDLTAPLPAQPPAPD